MISISRVLLFFTTLLISGCFEMIFDRKVLVGEIQLPIIWGEEFVFDYMPKTSERRLYLYLEPKEKNQRIVPDSIWQDCSNQAEKIQKPTIFKVYRLSPQKQKNYEESHYSDTGELTNIGKGTLRLNRTFAKSRCVETFRFGHTQFSITDSTSNSEPLIEFHISQRGVGALTKQRPVATSKNSRTMMENEKVLIHIFPTENDNHLITDNNPSGYYNVYVKEVEIRF